MVITGGDCPDNQKLQELNARCDCCVAADSGIQSALHASIRPDYLVGDMDSISNTAVLNDFPEHAVHTFPKDKDFTDTELALKIAREKGAESIIIAGGGGGRLDHELAVFFLFMKEYPPSEWHTANDTAILVEGNFSIQTEPGKRLSFFPLSDQTRISASDGLKWPLDGLDWSFGDHGISNVALREKVEIQLERGRLLLLFDSKKKDRP